MSEKKKILITGGLGYLGSRIAKDLSVSGDYQITLTTRRGPAHWPHIQLPGVAILQLDLLNVAATEQAISKHEVVVHLAGPDEKSVIQNPYASIDGALKATLNLLDASVKANIEHFFFFSTVHVYGSPLVGDISESTCPKPRHPYGILNRATEDYVLRYRDIHQLNAIVFRLSNAFGAPVHKDITRWSLVVNDLCRMAVEKGYIQLHSDGSQLRDFIPITDVSKATKFFLRLNREQTLDGIFNLGSGKSQSILDMAYYISSKIQQVFDVIVPVRKGGINSSERSDKGTLYINTSKIQSMGFIPSLNTEAEIQATLDFCTDWF